MLLQVKVIIEETKTHVMAKGTGIVGKRYA
jgi:hypothetical protein